MQKFVLFIITCTLFVNVTRAQSSVFSSGSSLGTDLGAVNLINVTIGGNFVVNGSFPATIGERVDQYISRLYERYIASLKQKDLTTNDLRYSKRDITLKHADGSSERIDLERFRLTGDFKHNPYLKRDDILIFPKVDLEKRFISVQGAVTEPGVYQYVEGDRLEEALLFSRGFDKAYDRIEEVRISRLSMDGENEDLIIVKPTENPVLRNGDRITVISEESYRKDYSVYVNGAVKYPGYIPITKNSTTLAEVIRKAGGFSKDADLYNAELLRGTNVFKSSFYSESFENMMMNRMADITQDDSISFFIDNKLRFSRANGIVDFYRLNDTTSQASHFILQPGDLINVPETVNLVYVFGHVYTPGYVQYLENKDFNYYLSKAGGIGQKPKGEIYLIKGKTRSWIKIDEKNPPKIEPGDFLWVPKEPTREFDYYLSRIQAVAGVVTALGTILLLVVQLSK